MITRFSRCLISLGAAASISLLAVSSVEAQVQADRQVPLTFPGNFDERDSKVSGHLWRLEVGSTKDDQKALEKVLALVQQNALDLWQVTKSHVDVYTPFSSSSSMSGLLPEELQAYAHAEPKNITAPSPRPFLEEPEDWNLPSLQNTTFHDHYHPTFEVEAFLNEVKTLHPELVTLKNLGHTGMGREMFGVTISKPEEETDGEEDKDGKKRKKKKKGKKSKKGRSRLRPHDNGQKFGFVVMGAQHAREWVATSSALYLIHALVADEKEDYSLQHLLDVFDFHIVPAPNPDGYDYTWETDRYWYKNRQRMGSKGRCFGLDMNRNWGYKWKPRPEYQAFVPTNPHSGVGKKEREPVDPCSDFYPGHRAFEAPEVNNIANWITTLPDVIAFLDLRSYGQMLSTPFSFSCSKIPKDAEDQIEAALGAAQAMKKVHGVAYTTGRLCEMLYHAPGNIVDWMYKRAGIKYSYVLHLRDTGTYGFTLPPHLIRPVGEETGEMVKYLAKFIAKQYDRKL